MIRSGSRRVAGSVSLDLQLREALHLLHRPPRGEAVFVPLHRPPRGEAHHLRMNFRRKRFPLRMIMI